ncbi:hypothetical protein QBC35DRAFT_66394 [Podospora australis]|uniref:Uncharacterized protein n=1 Tax=Podospora australis TaxID=1536484 RepID=A0AAN7AFR6_9PEZI|nr:hypothetical protein QBC35DRAFT_66394 [Podospora australis]
MQAGWHPIHPNRTTRTQHPGSTRVTFPHLFLSSRVSVFFFCFVIFAGRFFSSSVGDHRSWVSVFCLLVSNLAKNLSRLNSSPTLPTCSCIHTETLNLVYLISGTPSVPRKLYRYKPALSPTLQTNPARAERLRTAGRGRNVLSCLCLCLFLAHKPGLGFLQQKVPWDELEKMQYICRPCQGFVYIPDTRHRAIWGSNRTEEHLCSKSPEQDEKSKV